MKSQPRPKTLSFHQRLALRTEERSSTIKQKSLGEEENPVPMFPHYMNKMCNKKKIHKISRQRGKYRLFKEQYKLNYP
jgi:hypothetical protein